MSDLIRREDAIKAVVDTEGIKGFDYLLVLERIMSIPSASVLDLSSEISEHFAAINKTIRIESAKVGEVIRSAYEKERKRNEADRR